jgi:SAM-dependent methyltransferase
VSAAAKVVIALPAYHAARTLERTVAAIPEGVADELILVDDASSDETAEIARRLGLRVHVHDANRGYGGNQKSCYRLALDQGADIVVLLHPDYQYEPKAVPLLIAPILAGEADMTFGSRFAGMGDPIGGGMPMYRFVGNRITTVAQNLLLGTRFTDMHSGMRAYTRRALLSLPFLGYPEGFSFDAALLVDAVTTGLRVVEVPIPTRYTKESSSISISRSLRYVLDGTRYSAQAFATHGRRGRRYLPTWNKRSAAIAVSDANPGACEICGGTDLRPAYGATTRRPPALAEFVCTSEALRIHDDIVRCARCGALLSRPVRSADELLHFYEETEDPLYLQEEDARRATFAKLLRWIEGYHVGGRRLFEVGSNAGLFLAVASAHDWNASGTEPSTWAVEEGRRRFGVNLDVGAAETAQLPEGSVDVLAMFEVLDHVADPAAVLSRLRPTLAPEGLLAGSVTDHDGAHGRLARGSWPWFIRAHRTYLNAITMGVLLRRTGFELVSWRAVPASIHLSYLAERARELGPTGALTVLSRRVDPLLPVAWLGEAAAFIARPRSD